MEEKVTLKDISGHMGISYVTVSNALSGKEAWNPGCESVSGDGKFLLLDDVSADCLFCIQKQQSYLARGVRPTGGAEREAYSPFAGGAGRYVDYSGVDSKELNYAKKVVAASLVPVVLVDFWDEELGCDAILSNNYLGMYQMTRYLIKQGHREIAFVGNIRANGNIMDR